MMVNPTVQAQFNYAKGSLPMRLDVDTSAADACLQRGLDLIQNPDAIMRESDDWNTPAFTAAWGILFLNSEMILITLLLK
jgi:glucose/mannose transport system substrate-binding protein